MKLETSIEFINHASVLISYDNVGILSDPWYSGSAFHKGWNLLYENKEKDIKDILNKTTHLWISHEHPDHFSVPFFKTYSNLIKLKKIKILFQKNKDKRVISFIKSIGLDFFELDFNKEIFLSQHTRVICIKDGFYDSGLLIKNRNETILNLNDCEINTPDRTNEVRSIVGKVDILLTQFSFAAWKGGEKNTKWRKDAALEKIKTMELQMNIFSPKIVIPFASFIYFSNEINFYLNDAVNTPKEIIEYFNKKGQNLLIMKPKDVLGGKLEKYDNKKAVKFWESNYKKINKKKLNKYITINTKEISIAYLSYLTRIHNKNNLTLMRFLRFFSPIKVFHPVAIYLLDLKVCVDFDLLYNRIVFNSPKDPMITMHSESLYFLFKNTFGFDTLTVNGCFEEKQKNGFVNSTKTLAIENLNNLGIYISVKTLIDLHTIKLFLRRLYRVSRKLES